MELEIVTKVLLAVATVIGSYVASVTSSRQANKVKAELLEQFEDAVIKEQKHSVTELFRLLHGFRMKYEDILNLIDDDNCPLIISALSKSSAIVEYKDGKLTYGFLGKSKLFMGLDRGIHGIIFYGFPILGIASFFIMVFSKGIESVVGLGMLVFSAFFFFVAARDRYHNQMIEKLISSDVIDNSVDKEIEKKLQV